MKNHLDLKCHGYEIERELGKNRSGGRITYLAINTKTKLPVVIKQFNFAESGSNWAVYEAYDREIKVLQQLDHPHIPQYLDSVSTPSGFCLVQEYKEACALNQLYHFTPIEIKQIAIAVLEVLVYLQQQNPPIIHRDIKPENILVDRGQQLKVYLVDFGFARQGGEDLGVSSVVKGTLGFMPPEQLFNRQLTESSDLYSLGLTLICLLTKTKSTEIGNIIDESGQINFKHKLPKLNRKFVKWLEKITDPSLKNRFPNAGVALKALKSIDIVDSVKPKGNLFPVVGLASLGLIAFLSTTLSFYGKKNTPDPPETEYALESPDFADLKQLQQTGNCPGCNLRGADLQKVNLEAVNLKGANLKGANLSGANLHRAILKGADLSGADLSGANLRSADLTNASLKGANLTNAKLPDAHLENANLGNANLKSANLKGAILWNADLRGANLKDTKIKEENLKGAIMPDGSIY